MKRAVFTLWLLLAAVAATAQSEPTPPEFEYSDLQRLTPEDYIDMQLPPLHVLMENARHAPQVGYYESNREIEERELKTVRRNWMRNFKLNANYSYGSSDIYNQNYQDSNIPIWTTTTTGREQSWWNVGASLSIPLDEIFNRRNKIKQQKKRIENTQYDLDRWYDELRMKIIDAYTTAVEQLSILRSAAEAKITSEAQYRMTEVDFVKGKLDAQTLSRQKSLENSATREYEQVRRNLNDALLRLQALGRAAPGTTDVAVLAVEGAPAHRVRVAHGLPLNDYLGTGIAFKPHRASPADTWQYHLLLVESVPAGTEGTPVERNLVRNMLQGTWEKRHQLSKAEQTRTRFAWMENRPMRQCR